MQAIIQGLIAAVGPLLTQWLTTWLQSLFTKVSASMADPAPGAEPAARTALFDAAISHTPRLAFARRTLLRTLKTHAESLASGTVPDDAAAEIQDAAQAADGE